MRPVTRMGLTSKYSGKFGIRNQVRNNAKHFLMYNI
jgi:hypothetical protein